MIKQIDTIIRKGEGTTAVIKYGRIPSKYRPFSTLGTYVKID
jgi:hypothetical protein